MKSHHWGSGGGLSWSVFCDGVNTVSRSPTFLAQRNLLLPLIFGGGSRA